MNHRTFIGCFALLAACVAPPERPTSPAEPQPRGWPSPGAVEGGPGGLPRELSAGPEAAWQAGDEIPGWDDFECQELWRPRWRFSTTERYESGQARAYGAFGTTNRGRCSVERPAMVTLYAQGADVDADGRPLDIFFLATDGSYENAPQPRGQGWYVHRNPTLCAPGDRAGWTYAEGDSVGAPAIYDACYHEGSDIWHMPAISLTCISRLRPDQIRGTSWNWPLGPEEGGWAYPEDQGWIAIDFEINFPPHSGLRADQWDALPSDLRHEVSQGPLYYYTPAEPDTAQGYCGDGDYDSAWPWEDITDPFVRDIVYERYHPWQVDYLPEDVGR